MQTDDPQRTLRWSVVLVISIVVLAFMNDIADLFGFRAQWDNYGEFISVVVIGFLGGLLVMNWRRPRE